MMIKEIKQYIEDELSKDNKKPFKELYSYCISVYKRLNKDKVKLWNNKYYKKIKSLRVTLKDSKKIKGYTETSNKIKGYPYKKSKTLDIF